MISDVIMKRVMLLLVFILHLPAHAQERFAAQKRDTTTRSFRILDPGISSGKAEFLLPPSLTLPERDFPETFRTTNTVAPPFLFSTSEAKIDLLAPLRLQWRKEDELQTLYTIVGTVEFGGALYVAYRHLKKYGFK